MSVILSDSYQTRNVHTNFSRNSACEISWKYLSGVAFVPWRRRKIPKLTVAFRSCFANASKKFKLLYKIINIIIIITEIWHSCFWVACYLLIQDAPYPEDEDRRFLRNFDIYQTTRCHSQKMAVFTLTTVITINLTYLEQEVYVALRDSKYKKHGELRHFVINNPLRYY